MNKKAFIKYLCALILFGLNGIVASQIPMNSYEIVFLRTLIGSVLLIAIFLGERMSVLQIIGAVCIIGGSMVGELIKERNASK